VPCALIHPADHQLIPRELTHVYTHRPLCPPRKHTHLYPFPQVHLYPLPTHTPNCSSSGAQVSTVEVEDELLELWSSVEKEAAAESERRRLHAEHAVRADDWQARMALLSQGDSGRGLGGVKGGWSLLDSSKGAEGSNRMGRGEEESDRGDHTPSQSKSEGGPNSPTERSDKERRRGSAAAAHAEEARGPFPLPATTSDQQRLLWHHRTPSDASSTVSTDDVLGIPLGLARIRTSSRELLCSEDIPLHTAGQNGGVGPVSVAEGQQLRGSGNKPPRPPSHAAGSGRNTSSEGRAAAQQQQQQEEGSLEAVQASGQGRKEGSFWETLVTMVLDVWIVAW
jgi:hypothetical protein